jgi:hypothetical protein
MSKNKIKIKYNRLIFIITLFLAALFLLIVSSHTLIRQNTYLVSESKSKIQGEFNQKYKTIYDRFNKLSNICDYVNLVLPDLRDFRKSYSNTVPYIEAYEDIKDQLNKTASYNDFIKEIIVVSDNFLIASYSNRNIVFQYSEEAMQSLQNEYDSVADDKSEHQFLRVFYPPSQSSVDYIEGEYGFQKPMFKDGEFAGWIIIILDESIFEGFDDEEILILNKEDETVYGIETAYKDYTSIVSAYGEYEIDGDIEIYEARNQIVMKKQISKTNLSIAMVNNIGATDELSNYLPIIFTAAVSLLLAVLLSKMASNKITVPLKKLKRNVDNYKIGQHRNIKEGKDKKVNLSFRESILMYLIIVLLLPSSLFIFFSFMLSVNNFNNKIQESYTASIKEAVNNINVYMQDKEKILGIIVFDDNVQEKLYNDTDNEEFKVIINRAMKMGGYNNPIQIYDIDINNIYGSDVSDAGYILYPDETDEIASKRKIYNWISTDKNAYSEYEYSVLVKINSLEDFSNIGYLKSWVPESELESIYEDLSEAGITIAIIDDNKNIVSSQNNELIGS